MSEQKNEPHTIPELMQSICSIFCGSFCKWPDLCSTETELYEKHCNECPCSLLV